MSVTLAQMIADARAAVGEIPPADVREGIESGAIGLVLDVREPTSSARSGSPARSTSRAACSSCGPTSARPAPTPQH
jgi:hypothetical protein